MSNYSQAGPNKWSQTPRKVFDKYTEKMERKMRQNHDDARQVEAIVKTIQADVHLRLDEQDDLINELMEEIQHLKKKLLR